MNLSAKALTKINYPILFIVELDYYSMNTFCYKSFIALSVVLPTFRIWVKFIIWGVVDSGKLIFREKLQEFLWNFKYKIAALQIFQYCSTFLCFNKSGNELWSFRALKIECCDADEIWSYIKTHQHQSGFILIFRENLL